MFCTWSRFIHLLIHFNSILKGKSESEVELCGMIIGTTTLNKTTCWFEMDVLNEDTTKMKHFICQISW